MIKSSLPSILSCQEGENDITWQLFVDENLAYFNGHFEEQAVLPGVTQLDWAIRLGCEHFDYPVHIANIEVLKFQQLILPNTQVSLHISHNPSKAKLTFSYQDGEKRYGSGRISFVDLPNKQVG